MITKNEINALNLSPTKKDFVQIWNELLEVAGKLSERWDPTSTNESDPGIVLLKALTGIADKLNYNIDKNILEAFMPTAAQEDSMRKLCEMLGYNIKYYRSAQTSVNIKYYNSDPSEAEATAINKGLYIPKFTVITNSDKDINYFTINTTPLYISAETPSITVDCMEGQLVKCESLQDNNVITVSQISEQNRFYLPETQIAENGIFIYNVYYDTFTASNSSNSVILGDGEPWTPVENLNTQVRGTRVFKFGYDSYENRPYIEFPEDYSDLFNEGLFIYYTRTNGINGNVSAHTLTQLDKPNLDGWSDVPVESFTVDNIFAANNGANIETIKQAYKNFKKTIGTFDTLVTCRDYMNKVYLMTNSQNNPLVSNILVTDIRNDLNRAITICSCDDSGIFYREKPLVASEKQITEATKPVYNKNSTSTTTRWHLGSESGIILTKTNLISENASNFDATADGNVWENEGKWVITQSGTDFETKLSSEISVEVPMIDHFDLVFYPFKSYKQIKSNLKDVRTSYNSSFLYSNDTFSTIKQELEQSKLKTVAHNFLTPRYSTAESAGDGDIVSINNYLRLNATIATNTKITFEEGNALIKTIKVALANAFNLHELDFGEEIPFDSIVEVMENADSRIKVVSLNEPALYTTFSVLEKLDSNTPQTVEYAVASDFLSLKEGEALEGLQTKDIEGHTVSTFNTETAKRIYNKLALRNVLAGRVPLFNYNNTFKASFAEAPYRITTTIGTNTRWSSISGKPGSLTCPTATNPYTTYFDSDSETLYTARLFDNRYTVTKTETPEVYKQGVVSKVKDAVEDDKDLDITLITPYCDLSVENNKISEVTLGPGEAVKFRAPNFTTIKTYPAYVNYHLALNNELAQRGEAIPAEAISLYEILDSDRDTWSTSNTDIKWQKVLNYFENIDKNNGLVDNNGFVKTFKLKQQISAYNSGGTESDFVQKGAIIVDIDNNTAQEENIDALFAKSSSVKLANSCVGYDNTLGKYLFRANLQWQPANGEVAPAGEGPNLNIDIALPGPFITSTNTIATIQEAVNEAINSQVNRFHEDGITPILPAECSWLVIFEFKCVPFEQASLAEWEKFIKYCSSTTTGTYSTLLDGLKVVEDTGTVFWRKYDGGYNPGRAIMQSGEKLLKFDKNYFGLLPQDSYINGIFLISNMGADAKPNIIENDEEYILDTGEYLYIEYTPSSTTSEGTTQELPPVQEVYGEGTIIRPKGFEAGLGLMDSDALVRAGTSTHKNVTFVMPSGGVSTIGMHRFGANEQVEIRDYAKVTLSKDTFKKSPIINVYKNFNNCPELEDKNSPIRKYTLKDGEYIFYSDQNKTEIAFYTSGTEVSVTGDFVLPQRDIIDIETILESGSDEIPWQEKVLVNNDAITFQEYQYIKLGNGDKIEEIELENACNKLGKDWVSCTKASYTLAGNVTNNGNNEIIELPAVNVGRPGNGWEVCSILEVNTSPEDIQILRSSSKITTGIKVNGVSEKGNGTGVELTIKPEVLDNVQTSTLMFKTNLSCQSVNNNTIDIKDVYNKDKISGFQLKVFAKDQPEVVETLCGKPLPNTSVSIDQWKGLPLAEKSASDIWNQVGFDKIKVNVTGDNGVCDTALRLPINIIPDTYGIVSFYINYTSTMAKNKANTWIEVMDDISDEDIKILNRDTSWEDGKLYLEPGINCLRFNKSGHIFIKTSNDSQGILFFDDLKLVNCEKIQYQTSAGSNCTESTNGLNLKQLGYLKLQDTNNLVDQVVSTALEKALCETFEQDLNKLTNELTQDTLPIITYFGSATHLETFKENLDNLSTKNTDLLGILKETYSTYKSEEDLLNTLSSDSLEEKLLVLISNFAPSDVTDQQLLAEFDSIKNQNLTNAKNSNIESILNSFKVALAKNKVSENILTNIKNTTIQKLDIAFNSEATILVNELEKTASAENKSRISTILATLQDVKSKASKENVQFLLNKLHSSLEISDIKAKIEEISQFATDELYADARSIALELKNLLSSKDSLLLLEELRTNLENENSNLTSSILSELTSVLNTANDLITNEDYGLDVVISLINGILTSSGATQTALLEMIDSFQSKVITVYTSRVSSLMVSLERELKSITDNTQYNSLKTLIESLTTEDNNQIDILVTKLLNLIDLYSGENGYKQSINNLSNLPTWNDIESLACFTIFKDTIIVIWADFILNNLEADFSTFRTQLETFIKGTSKFNSSEVSTKINALKESYQTLCNSDYNAFLDLTNLDSLVTAAEVRCLAIHRNLSIIATANQIQLGSTIFEQALIDSFKASTKTGLIVNILTELQILQTKNTITIEDQLRKSKLITQLKDEINIVKQADKQILDILEQELYPNIIKVYNESADKEAFDYKIATRLRDELCKGVVSLADLTAELSNIITLVTNIKNNTLASLSVPNPENLLLATEKDSLKDLLTKAGIINKVVNIKNAKIINILNISDKITQVENWMTDSPTALLTILEEFKASLEAVKNKTLKVTEDSIDNLAVLALEQQLLSDILAIDKDRDFYYSAPIENRLAIEFTTDNAKNSLMNPAVNYDINNVNNSFVVSKLDIDYLDKGLQLARSSRLN